MKQQIVVTHTIHQTEISALLDSWVTNTSSVKMYFPSKIFVLMFLEKHNLIKGWSIEDQSSFFFVL